MKSAVAAFSIAWFAAFGCSSPPADEAADAGVIETDAGANEDASANEDAAAREDAAAPDAGANEDAASSGDASVPWPGFGAISGACGVLDDELTSSSPSTFVNHIDFMIDGYDDADFARLSAGGQEIINDGNAGGNSLLSEVFSYEVLNRCEGALLLKTETEVLYTDSMGKITDLLVELDGLKIGVSVTRAVAFPFDQPYPPEQAMTLMQRKLSDILLSTANVAPEDAWTKQVLHIIAYSDQHAAVIDSVLQQIDPAVRADTVVIVTITDGDDAFIY